MRRFLTFLTILSFAQSFFGQKNLVFQKNSNGKEISVALPTTCSFLTIDNIWQEGKIFDRTDSSILWSYHFHDSLKFYEIVKNKTLSKKEKKLKTDSLYKADSIVVISCFKDIKRINFKTYAIKPTKYKKRRWSLIAISQASAVVVLIAVIFKLVPLAQIAIPVYTITFASVFLSNQKRIRLSKWNVKT